MKTPATILLFWLSLCCLWLSAQDHRAAAGDWAIAGTVVSDLDGYPLPRTRVTLFAAGNGSLASSTDTDESGRFEFHVPKAGKYSLSAQRRGFPPQRFDEHEGYSTAIAVGPDKESTGLIYRLKPSCSLFGTITDEAGEPVRNGQVMLFRKAMQNGQLTFQSRWSSGLDDRGMYHFGNLPAGNYFLSVQARPWYARNSIARVITNGKAGPRIVANPELDVAYPITYYPAATDPDGARAIVLRPGDRTTADMALAAVPALHLQIANVDDMGVQPALHAKTLGGHEGYIFSETDRISPDKIEITGIAPGNYRMSLQTSDPNSGKPQIARQQAIKITSDGEIDFARTAALPAATGVVVFEGAPKPQQAQLSLSNRDTNEGVSAQVSADGTFAIPSVSPGWYDVTVPNIGSFSIKSVSAIGARVAGLRVQFAGSGQAKLAITMSAALGSIEGVVKSEGKTIAGAMVVLVPEDAIHHHQWFRRDQSDSDGTFSLGQILPGKYTLLAIRDGWDMEWSRPEVLERFLPGGEVLQVQANGKLNATVKLQ